jgi:hypothetical protein
MNFPETVDIAPPLIKMDEATRERMDGLFKTNP